MRDSLDDDVEIDDLIALTLARAADHGVPRPEVKDRLMARLRRTEEPVPAPAGF
jgi:hypothetical protein